MFTDEQLNQIKAACLVSYDEHKNKDAKDILDLIERLAAAEVALVELYSLSAPITDKGIAWRKAKGSNISEDVTGNASTGGKRE